MSGFTRDPRYYGDRLVYEALLSKWSRYHRTHCRCGNNWITHHVVPAGFTVVREGSGFVALAGPGLTDGVDETRLTTNALWEAVTGKPGAQDWFESVTVVDRPARPPAAAAATGRSPSRQRRPAGSTTATEPVTAAQLQYLTRLITSVSRERFNAEFAAAIKGTTIAPRGEEERTMQAVNRLTKHAASTLITRLRT